MITGTIGVIVRHQPPAIVALPVPASMAYKLQVPFGFVPEKIEANVALPKVAGGL